jgi:hypothetical protein
MSIRNKSIPAKNYARARLMRLKYGITLLHYQRLFEDQYGACAMCKRKSERSLCVDHCHRTNKVRGLLCNACNALLGFAQEDINILESAIKYLNEKSFV